MVVRQRETFLFGVFLVGNPQSESMSDFLVPSLSVCLSSQAWAEDSMNALLEGVTVTARDGKITNLEVKGREGEMFQLH